ncbi:hypothetical protein D3C83_247580 [compost metagenome]
MHGREHRDRFFCYIHAGKYPRRFGDTRQPFMNDLGAKVFQVQVDMVLVRPDATAFADLNRH